MSPRRRRVRGEGSIYRDDARGRWVGEITITSATGQRQRRRVTGATAEEVAQRLADLRGNTAHRDTLHGFLRWYTGTYLPDQAELGELHPRTIRSSRAGLQHVIDCTPATLRLDQLDAERLDQLRRSLAQPGRDRRSGNPKPLAASTQRRVLSQLAAAIDVAVYYDLVDVNRVRLMPKPKVPAKRRPILEPAQARVLLDDVAGHRLEPWYAVAVPCGMRRAEALGLAWEDVDLDAGMLRLTHQLQREEGGGGWIREPLKGRDAGEGREVQLADFQVQVLRRHRTRQAEERLAFEGAWGNPWDLVIVDRGGVPVWGDQVWRDVVRRCARLGLPKVTPHSFRRSAFSILLARGVDVATAMRICGWQSSAVALEVYAQVTAGGLDQVAAVWQELYGDR